MEINSKDIIVYTCLIGAKEDLNAQPQIRNSKLRHVCLTDNKDLKSNEWEIVYVDKIIPQDSHRSQRNYKIRPHLIFKSYKYSFYIDNTVILKKKSEDFIEEIINKKNLKENQPFFVLPTHSSNNDLLTEFNMCSSFDLDNQIRFYEQLTHYIKTNLHYLNKRPFWAAILFRNHSNDKIINLSEIWFAHVCRYSRRDQLSIIHASKQAQVDLLSLDINNNSSEFHSWPVTKNNKDYRIFKEKFIDFIPHNLLKDIEFKMSENEKILARINSEKKLFKKSFLINLFELFFSRIRVVIKRILTFIIKKI